MGNVHGLYAKYLVVGFGETEHVKMGCIFMDVLIQILLTTEVDFALNAMFPVGFGRKEYSSELFKQSGMYTGFSAISRTNVTEF